MSTTTINSSWRSEIKPIVLLGLPLISAQLAQIAINITNTLVLGRLGAEPLAASVLGWQLFFVVWIFGTGFGFAVMPFVAGAASAKDKHGVSRYAHMGLWLSFIYSLLVFLPLWYSEYIFLALQQDPAISKEAAKYVRILQLSMFPQLAIIVLRSWLGGLQKPTIVVLALGGGAIINLFLNIGLVFGKFGMPALGIEGAAYATLVAMSCVFIFLYLFCSKHPSLVKHKLGQNIFSLDAPAFKELFKLGWPIGITVVAEVGLFTATSIMMGWLGAAQLAAHGIAVQLSGLTFMAPLGLSAAATIRVGWALGANNRASASRAAWTAIIIGLGFACLSAFMFITYPEFIVGLYLDLNNPDSAAVLAFGVSFLAVAAAFQIVDSLQALANGSLRGLKDTRIPMILALFSYWVIGVPVAYILAFKLNMGGIGVWWGLASGLAAAAISLNIRLVSQIKHKFTH